MPFFIDILNIDKIKLKKQKEKNFYF